MLLTKEKLQHINTIAHEGKVVVFATDGDGKIHYIIKQDGFEDSYLNTPADQRTGWEDWQELEFPNETTDDQSVIDKETEKLTHKDDTSQFILRSRYRTRNQSAVAPVQVVSGVGHIYVFRQSKADATETSPNTLLVDRFVLDGMTNKLVRKLEVRFKRSRQKYEPTGKMKKKANGGGLVNIDSLDFRDANGKQFYEPTTELSLIKNLHNGWFSVVLMPTNEHENYRWHIFAYNSVTQKVELTTIRSSEEGLFDVQDYTVFEEKPEAKSGLVPRSIPGIIQRSLDLNGVQVANGFSATKYDIQKEQQTKDGMQLLKDATKVMLAIPNTAGSVAAISFSVAADGTLSQINETPDNTNVLRSDSRDLLLPLNTLDEIKGIGDSTPSPQGTITGVKRGEEDTVQIISSEASTLSTGDRVKITGTQSYNGHYIATNIDGDSFEVEASYVNGDIGEWEKVPKKETGLIFDGAITCFERVTDNKLKITALNHGLESGDEVQIIDTTDYNRTCGIEKIDESNFAIEKISWKSGEAVNLKLESRKRRGVMFNGIDEYIAIPKLQLTPPSTEFAFGYTVSAWVYLLESSSGNQAEQLATLATQKQSKQDSIETISGEITAQEDQKQAKQDSIETILREITAQEDQKQAKQQVIQEKEQEYDNLGFSNIDQTEVDGRLFTWQLNLEISPSYIPGDYRSYLDNPPQISEFTRAGFIQTLVAENTEFIEGLVTGFQGDFEALSNTVKWQVLKRHLNISTEQITYLRQEVEEGIREERAGTISREIEQLQDDIDTIQQTIINKESAKQQLQDDIDTIEQTINNKEAAKQQLQDDIGVIEEQEEAIRNKKEIIIGEKEKCLELFVNNGNVSLKVKFADGNEQVTDTVAVTKGQWIHYAGIIAADGTSEKTTLTICKNGQQVGTALEVQGLPQTREEWKPEFEIGKAFTGKIADAQIWDKARSVKEVKDSMYLQLTGREVDLEGYWRLGAITEGTQERKVVDFSANGNDGTVKGNAFVSAITLKRTLGDNTTQVVKYTNDDLTAVSASATYVETFEFKTDPTVDPNNIDGEKLFSFSYWGKNSRSSDKKITFTGTDNDFESLDHNWYKATCRFTVPDGVAMMRTFELADVKGTWSTLEIRKHRVQLMSDSITEVKYTDSVSLSTLANQFTQLPRQVETLKQKEQEEAKLLREKWELEDAIARIDNLPLLRRQVEVLQEQVTTVEQQCQNLKTSYDQETSNPFNYECYLNMKVGNEWKIIFASMDTWKGQETLLRGPNNGIGNVFRFLQQGDGDLTFFLEVKVGNIWKKVYVGDAIPFMPSFIFDISPNYDGVGLFLRTGNGNLCQFVRKSGNNYNIKIKVGSSSWKGVHVHNQYNDNGTYLTRHRGDGNLFFITKTQQTANQKVQNAKEAWETKTTELRNQQRELTRLENLLNAGTGQKSTLENRLQSVNNKLTTVQNELNTANNTVITTVRTTQQRAQALPTLHTVSQGFQKGLVTKGALLGFAAPTSPITAMETCEGKVQLSYFDNQGRMRLTNYDATSDSQNTTFEQWVPDELPVALNFADNSDKIQLTNPISQGQESTIEAWFSYPLPEKTWNALASSEDDTDQQIVVYEGKWLGTRINGFFRDSGYNLETLSNNWHHLAAARRGSEGKATTTFYIDGKKVGEVKSLTALEFDGTDDYVEVAAHTNPTTAITVSLWAKSSTDNWNNDGCLASKRDAYILHPIANSKTIKFYIYASGWHSISHTPSDIKQWHHYVGTFDGTTLKLYVDGVQVASQNVFDATTAINSDSGALSIGKDDGADRFFGGQIAEVRVWNTARMQEQIQADMGKVLKGDESGLVGYWRFAANSAKDLSSSGKDGTLHGEPKAVTLSAKNISNIKTIGNTQAGSQQFGKLAELRVWNIALKEVEIAANSKTRLSGNEPGLAAYYPLNEATGTEARDLTGSGNNGTITGASWWGCSAPIGNLGHTVMEFDGNGDYVNCGSNILAASYTQEAWVKCAVGIDNTYRTIVGADGHNGLAINNNRLIAGHNQNWYIAQDSEDFPEGMWVHVAFTYDGNNGQISLYKNGQLIPGTDQSSINISAINPVGSTVKIGSYGSGYNFQGQIAEVRIWNKARTAEEIQADMHQQLTGYEANLVAYFPLNNIQPEGDTIKVLDLSSNNNHGTVNGAIIKDDNTLPIAGNALVSAEYSTIGVDKVTGKKTAIMRRFLGSPALNGVELLPDKRIEELELKWIGNAQFAPTLLGYIEGAPPIPSENLTVQADYNGATSVELTMSEDVEFSWNRSQEAGLGAAVEMFMGADTESHLGFGGGTKVADVRAGFKGNLDFSYNFLNETSISSGSALTMSDRLELRGTQEPDVKFPHLGKRFIPKNVGYALVVSSLADVFITRLRRTQRMIGYQVQPVDGIPPDVNTITFLINPAYTMSGSLDGMTGTSATSDRFFRHVPEMRAQYGSLYPASYYRLQEAYDLKQKIDQEDKRRESYFAQFNALLVDEGALERETNKGEAPQDISLEREEDQADEDMTEEEKQAQEEAKQKQREEEAREGAVEQKDKTKQKQKEINSRIADQDTRVHASDSFASWQRKMEAIQVRAGKRNIVNTYVWDADGGLRTEAQSFANTAEHTIGGSFSLNAGLGLEAAFGFFGAAVELTAQATVNMTQTMSKTESRSKGFDLSVDLSGVECTEITDYNDYPLQPGEKVDRYRFMSFYLEGTTKNFNDFFDYVVDPEWLASNDEEARALRQAKGKANKTWRVLHRVTYVERPALMGFGQDSRQTDDDDLETKKIVQYFDDLEEKNQELQTQLDTISNKLAELDEVKYTLEELKTLLQNQQSSGNGSSQTESSTESSQTSSN